MKHRLSRAEWALFLFPFLSLCGVWLGTRDATFWHQLTGRPIQLRPERPDTLSALELSSDGSTLAVAGRNGSPGSNVIASEQVFLFDAHTLKPKLTLELEPLTLKGEPFRNRDVMSLKLSSNEQLLLVAVHNGLTQIYDLAEHRLLWTTDYFQRQVAMFSPQENRLVLGQRDRYEARDARTGQVLHSWQISPNPNDAQELALDWSRDGRLLASTAPRLPYAKVVNDPEKLGADIEIRDAHSWKVLRTLSANDPRRIVFSPDGKFLCALETIKYGFAVVIRVFDVKTGKQQWSRVWWRPKVSDQDFPSPWNIAWTSDGHEIATWNKSHVVLHSATTGQETRRLTRSGGNLERVDEYDEVRGDLAFSPDGKRLFAHDENSVLVWDLE